jgi:hypothetical protein
MIVHFVYVISVFWCFFLKLSKASIFLRRMLLLTCNLKIGDFLVKAFKELLLEHHKVIGDQI